MSNTLKERPDIRRAEEESTFDSFVDNYDKTADSAQENRAIASMQRNTSKKSTRQRVQGFLKGSKSRTPLIAVLIGLFGGGSAFFVILGPGISLLALVEGLPKDLNSQLAGVDKTTSQLWRAKLQQTTSGACGIVKIACRYETVNVEKMDKAVKNTAISVRYDKTKGILPGSGKIQSLDFTSPTTGKKLELDTPDKFERAMRENIEFRDEMFKVHNPKFVSWHDAPAMKFLAKMRTDYSQKLTGTTQEELDSQMKDAVSGASSIDTAKLTQKKDENGETYYEDENGTRYTQEEANSIAKEADRLKSATPTKSFLSNIKTGVGKLTRGVSLFGAADTGCTVINQMRNVEIGAKVIRARELIRYAMVVINTGYALKAGVAKPEQVEYVSKPISEIDTDKQVVDESKLASTKYGDAVPMIENPSYGQSGMDAEFYKLSADQEIPKKTTTDMSRFMATGVLVGTLAAANKELAPLRGQCKYVQNTAVRAGGLILGVAAGIGTFGLFTAFSFAGSTALAMLLPLATAQLADMAAGRVTDGLKGKPSVNATAVGVSSMLNGFARQRGMLPLKPKAMAAYQNTNRQVELTYEEVDRYAATKTPFDMSNQYSFLGSLARTTLPMSRSLASGLSGTFQFFPQLAHSATISLFPSVNAATSAKVSPERYEQVTDSTYNNGQAIDATGVMPYGVPQEAMDIDPSTNAVWMAQHGEIDPNSEEGEAVDNGQSWNYVKYLKNCVEEQPGAHEESEGDESSGCTDDANYEKNWHYVKYKLSNETNPGIEAGIAGLAGTANAQQASATGVPTGEIGLDGWAYPTTKDAVVTSPFGPRDGEAHNGADLAQPTGALNKPIYAARDGKVIAAGPAQGYGNWIVIESRDKEGRRVETIYGHMYDDGYFVKLNDMVKAGQPIGKIGSNGNSSGPHLHFEVRVGGRDGGIATGSPIDPKDILKTALQTDVRV